MGGGHIQSGGHAVDAKVNPSYYAAAAKEIEKTVLERGLGSHAVKPRNYTIRLVVAVLCAPSSWRRFGS